MTTERTISKRTGFLLRAGAALATLAYGISIADPGAPRLMAFGLALFALPLLLQAVRSALIRAYALWFGGFLVVQSVMAPVLLGDDRDLLHHVPNLTRIMDAKTAEAAGGNGSQMITTDTLGFRVIPRVDYSQRADLRIFAIGGSTTHEYAINDLETWTHRVQVALAEKLPGQRVEVINTGVSGLMSQHHLATLRYVRSLHPNMALFLVGANDWNFDIRQQFGDAAPARRLLFPDTPLGRLARISFYRLAGPTVYGAPTVSGFTPPGRSLNRERKISWFPDKVSDRYLADLAKISDTCREANLRCVFMTQPNAYHPDASQQMRDRFWMTPHGASYTLTFDSLIHVAQVYNRALTAFARERGHPVCDLAQKIEPTAEIFSDEFHFTFKGSARVAELVTDCLRPLIMDAGNQHSPNALP